MVWFSLFAFALCFLPPTRLLGYEHAWAVLLFGTALGAWLIRRERWPRALAAFLLPLGVGLGSALFVKNCNLPRGIAWYFVLAMPALIFSWQLAKAVPAWLYYGLVAASVGRVLYGLYAGPQMRFYDPLLGFFAGSIYDEALAIPTPLYWHALMLVIGALALGARSIRLAAIAVLIFAFGEQLDLRTSHRKLAGELSQTVVTPHLVIHFSPNGTVAKTMPGLWPEIERRAEAAATALATKAARPTHLYIYDDGAQKERLMGARQTLFTRPWVPEIHYLYAGPDVPALAHELIHTTASGWNDSLLSVPARFGLPQMASVEGLAVALSPSGDLQPEDAICALEHTGHAPDIGELFSPFGFYQDSGERAYLAAGAYTAWFLRQNGLSALRAAYADGGLKPTPQDVAAFRAEIGKRSVDALSERYFAAQFREAPIYARVCGREQAVRLQAAQTAMGGQHYDEVFTLCDAVLHDYPHNLHAELVKIDA